MASTMETLSRYQWSYWLGTLCSCWSYKWMVLHRICWQSYKGNFFLAFIRVKFFILKFLQIWDLASGRLKLSLTGHVSTVRALQVSPRHPYLFSAGEDRQVKCWDLEYNKVAITISIFRVRNINKIFFRLSGTTTAIWVPFIVWPFIQPLTF